MAAGKPAVPATAALVWHACSLAGMRPSKPGLGRLFAPLVPECETQHLHHALGLHLSTGTKSFALSKTPPLVVSGAGTWLTDTEGKRYLDFACGSGTTVLGHGHPAVMRAIREQLACGVTHLGPHFHAPVQIRLMERLASVLPSELSVFHPVTNGTEAVEAALKAAIHATGRRRFIAFEGAYHGRTLGSLALSYARGSNAVLGVLVPDTTHLPYPLTAEDVGHLTARLGEELARGDVAAVIAEPVQATAGMRVPAPGWLHAVRKATEKSGTVLIIDEVFTGYGRTGRLFGFEWSDEVSRTGIVPDLLVLGKAASGGIPGAILAGRRDKPPRTRSTTACDCAPRQSQPSGLRLCDRRGSAEHPGALRTGMVRRQRRISGRRTHHASGPFRDMQHRPRRREKSAEIPAATAETANLHMPGQRSLTLDLVGMGVNRIGKGHTSNARKGRTAGPHRRGHKMVRR
jgi:hypothetical protein